MPKISVVMPAFNVEKYIGEAIESIINQTLADWELIIVDDCSTDSTCHVVEQYVKKDHRIKLIKRNQNSGSPRIPRHQAIMLSTGEFVCKIDSDDVIESSYLQKMYDRHIITKADGVTSRLKLYDSNLLKAHPYTIPAANYDMSQILSGKEACRISMGALPFSFNGYTCRTEIYQRYISEDGNLDINTGFADEIDDRKIMLRLKTVAFCDTEYKYRQQAQSVVHDHSIKAFYKLHAYKARLELSEKEFDDEYSTIVATGAVYLENIYRAQILFEQYKKSYTPQEKLIIKKLLKEAFNDLHSRNFKFYNKKKFLLNSSYFMLKLIACCASTYSKIRLKFK